MKNNKSANNGLATNACGVSKSDAFDENVCAVASEVEKLNALYSTVCAHAAVARKMLSDRGIKSKIGFYNNHAIAIPDTNPKRTHL